LKRRFYWFWHYKMGIQFIITGVMNMQKLVKMINPNFTKSLPASVNKAQQVEKGEADKGMKASSYPGQSSHYIDVVE
ncbi:MAG: hypothetical protein ACTSRA_17660, partial [Promethearchaeota archaeon]